MKYFTTAIVLLLGQAGQAAVAASAEFGMNSRGMRHSKDVATMSVELTVRAKSNKAAKTKAKKEVVVLE